MENRNLDNRIENFMLKDQGDWAEGLLTITPVVGLTREVYRHTKRVLNREERIEDLVGGLIYLPGLACLNVAYWVAAEAIYKTL